MATAQEKKYARTYYKTHRDYREKKIKQRSEYYQSHKKEEAKYQREYYWKNPQYREQKRKYARNYKKRRRT